MKTLKISAYRSAKKDELYLYIKQETKLEDLPAEMMVMFGKAEHVIDFELDENRKLPRAEAKKVIEAVETKGFYIQMPPEEVEKLGDMPAPPEHLDNIY